MRRRQLARELDHERDRDGGTVRDRLERRAQAAVAEHCRVDAARELAQLGERDREVGRAALERGGHRLGIVRLRAG